MEKTKIISVLAITAALAGVSLAQGAWNPSSYTLQIAPPHPNSTEAITLTLSGQWPDSCVPVGSAISVVGNDILWDIQLDMSDHYCLQVISSWHQTRTLDPLAVGVYRVRIRPVEDGFLPIPYFTIGTFRVSPPPATTEYGFLPEQSILTISGGIAGMMFTCPVWGSFRLTVDPASESARFDSVQAWYERLDPLGSDKRDLGELFRMTELVGKRISPTQIEFTGKTEQPVDQDIKLCLTFKGDRVRLTGGFPPSGTCCDFIFYELDAWAQTDRPPCQFNLAGDLNDDCKVDLADLAIFAADWLIDCILTPDNPACIAK